MRDTMTLDQIVTKTGNAGFFGSITSGVGIVCRDVMDWAASDVLHKALGNFLLVLFAASSLVAICSAVIRLLINIRKNRMNRINEVRLETEQCNDCRDGSPPIHCLIPIEHRPKDCKAIAHRNKVNKLHAHMKQEGLIASVRGYLFKGDSTTKQ
jgi:hypothetical protein